MAQLYSTPLFIDANLQAYYRMEGNSNDSKNSNNGTDSNMAYAAAKYGQGASFNGTTSVVTVANHSSIQNIFDGGGSVAAWIYPNSDGEGDFGKITDKTVWTFDVNTESSGTCKLRFVQTTSGTAGIWSLTSADITIGAWNHVAVTYNSAALTTDPVIYVNGAAKGVTESSTPTGTYSTDTGSSLYLGNASANNRTFDGLIDDLALFDKAISAAEVLSLYRVGTGSLFFQQI